MDQPVQNRLPITILLVAGIVVLLVLVVVTSLYQQNEEQKAEILKLTPTPIRDARGRILSPTPNPYPPLSDLQVARNKKAEPTIKAIKVLTPEERNAVQTVRTRLPVITNDYEIGYSDYFDKFFIYRKTPQAQEGIQSYFESQNLGTVFEAFPDLFIYVSAPVEGEIQKAEDELFNRRLQARHSNIQGVATVQAQDAANPEPIDDSATIPDQTDSKHFIKYFVNLLRGLPEDTDLDQTKYVPGSPPAGSGGGGGNFSGSGNLPATGDLAKIFNEAATKIGTPAKILQAVMRHECGRLLDPGFTTDAQIAEWSTPGKGLPPDHFCFENDGGDQGPMQFNKYAGSFSSYGSAVNEYGGYSHTPYVENIRDAVYAAALKLRAESNGATPGGQWTREQVIHAIICYNAGCGRVDNPPSSTRQYAEEVWQEYSSS